MQIIIDQIYLYTLSKKRNSTNLNLFNFSFLLIRPRVLGGSLIRHAIDPLGMFIQAEQFLFQCIIPEFGASHGRSVLTSTTYLLS